MIKSSLLAVGIGLISILWATNSQAQVYYPINALQPAPVVYQSLRPVVIGRMPIVPARVYRAPIYQAPVYQAPTYSAPTYSAPTYSAPTYSAPTYSAPTYSAPVVQTPTVQTVQRPVVTGSWQPVTSFRPTIIPSSPTLSTRFYDAPITVQRPIYQSPSDMWYPQVEKEPETEPQYRTEPRIVSGDQTISQIQSRVDTINRKIDLLLKRVK